MLPREGAPNRDEWVVSNAKKLWVIMSAERGNE